MGIGIPDGDAPGVGSGSGLPPLTPAEDAELRQLAWFAKAGQLSEKSQTRLSDLKARDRRQTIRDPRPDPASGGYGAATRFESAPASARTCPNCGSGVVKLGGRARSCPNCGCPVRNETLLSDDPPAPAGAPTSDGAGLPAVGSLDKHAFRALLLGAAMGGVPSGDT